MLRAYRAAVLKLAVMLLLPLSLLAALSMMGGKGVYGDSLCIYLMAPSDGENFGDLFDLRTGRTVWVDYTRSHYVRVSPNGRHEMVAERPRARTGIWENLILVDKGDNTERIIAQNVAGQGYQWSKDGRNLAYLWHEDGANYFNLTFARPSGELLATLPTAAAVTSSGALFAYGFSPDQRYFAYGDAVSGHVTYIDLQDHLFHETRFDSVGGHFVWSPQGHELLITTQFRGNTFRFDVISPEGHVRLGDVPGQYPGLNIAWSPDGQSVAVQTLNYENPDLFPVHNVRFRDIRLYVMNRDGSRIEIVNTFPAFESVWLLPIIWSADSQSIMTWRVRGNRVYDWGYYDLATGGFEAVVEGIAGVIALDDTHMLVVTENIGPDRLLLIDFQNPFIPITASESFQFPYQAESLNVYVRNGGYIHLTWSSHLVSTKHVVVIDTTRHTIYQWSDDNIVEVQFTALWWIYFVKQFDGERFHLYRRDLLINSTTLLASSRQDITWLRLSPWYLDAFQWINDTQQRMITILNADGQVIHQLDIPPTHIELSTFSLSSDEQQIALITVTTQGHLLEIGAAFQQSQFSVLSLQPIRGSGAWHPFNNSIAFVADDGRGYRLHHFHLSGRVDTYLTHRPDGYYTYLRGLRWLPCALDPA
jgi:hypothetical protein